MKVAVYSIAKNEEKFVEKWAESAKDADYLYVLDTGSTDKTIELCKKNNINVYQKSIYPWRFDVARNESLNLIPKDIDYCIALDMDEVLQPGWRQSLEEALYNGYTRPRYEYTWSWDADGNPGLVYGGDKIHSRNGYKWKNPVHEVLIPDIEEKQGWIDLRIHHYPDLTKSRGQYLPLLKMAVEEDPTDDRNAYYYARELYFYKENKLAEKEFKRYLSLPTATWLPERSAAMRYLSKTVPEEREKWLLKSAAECPDRREPWVELAEFYYEVNNWESSYASCLRALNIKNKPLEYLCEDKAWSSAPYDYAAIAACNMNLFDKAFEYGKKAAELSPNDNRIINNLRFYQNKLNSE